MTVRIALLALALALGPNAAAALTLAFPGPVTKTVERATPGGRVNLPVAAFDGDTVRTRTIEGQVMRQAWRLPEIPLTTIQIAAPLRQQLQDEGFDVVFECRDVVCGGYDFRFKADVLGEPEMHVDLGDFHYLMAESDTGEAVSLMVSRSPGAGFVQLTQVGGAAAPKPIVTSTKSAGFALTPGVGLPVDGVFLTGLSETGRAPLDDLQFATGSADLERSDAPSLGALATFLTEHPGRNVTLVGHTDAEGSPAGNINLSRRRADSVRRALIRDHGVSAARLTSEGVGHLSPRASNDSEDGRLANRRVEVILNE